MEPIATWETPLLGVLALLVILWFSPGRKNMIGVSRDAKSDWIGHTHRDGEPFRGCVDPDNLKSVVQ